MGLFGPTLPPGFNHRDAFVSVDEASQLADAIAGIEFGTFEMRGVVAKRRVAFFGHSYDEGRGPERPIPEFLFPLRERFAVWANVDPQAFVMALINEYRPGAPIGWHRDAPQYDIVAGLSLLSAAWMRLRPYVSPKDIPMLPGPRKTTHEIELQPRSAYILAGESRQAYEHSIPPVDSLRYSVTFRTLRSNDNDK